MIKLKKIALVIINYNDYNSTKHLLENVKSYKCLDLIVVVDNNSTDDSYKKLKKYDDDNINVIKSKRNNGYASGLNFGAKYVIEKLGKCNIVFSNSDIIINNEGDIKELSKTINKMKVKVAGPVIVEGKTLNRGWKLSNTSDEILYNLPFISRYFKKKLLYYDEEYYKDNISMVGAVSGCFFVIDSTTLEDINYFDENTFLYYEENILAKKLRKINKQIAVNNMVVIVHNHSVTIDKNFDRVKKYKMLKESQKYYVENYLEPTKNQLFLLLLTNKLSLGILYMKNMFRK